MYPGDTDARRGSTGEEKDLKLSIKMQGTNRSGEGGARKKSLLFTWVHSNQDLIWCVKIGVYSGFCVHDGS